MKQPRLRMAIQKSGRLEQRSIALLEKCGIEFSWRKNSLLCRSRDFPLDVMLVRDDDIPEYVRTGVCDLGIVGENVLAEKLPGRDPARPGAAPPDRAGKPAVRVIRKLGFGHCRLSLAVPRRRAYDNLASLEGARIATSYPEILARYLVARGVTAEIVELAGAVEIAPALEIADAICDLVSSGATLESNGLEEVETVLVSQAVLVGRGDRIDAGGALLSRLIRRIDGVLRAGTSKYVMMNAPASRVEAIRAILPGMEAPSVLPLFGDSQRVAIHAVAAEDVFWETIERLEEAGATGILVVPIEKIIG